MTYTDKETLAAILADRRNKKHAVKYDRRVPIVYLFHKNQRVLIHSYRLKYLYGTNAGIGYVLSVIPYSEVPEDERQMVHLTVNQWYKILLDSGEKILAHESELAAVAIEPIESAVAQMQKKLF